MARRRLISGNWKMNLNHFDAITLVQKLGYELGNKRGDSMTEVTVHPPFTDIRSVQTTIQSDKLPIGLGAQHCYFAEKGAFTGEVAPAMLAKLDVEYVIVGHSERRWVFGETDEMVNKKTKAVLANGMVPIVCVGEQLDEREMGKTKEVVVAQTKAALAGVHAEQVARLVIAYEPVWAIGTGKTATAADAQETCADIRACVAEVFGKDAGLKVRIQYGGSANAGNAAELLAETDVDGLLVGGASLKAEDFAKMIAIADEK